MAIVVEHLARHRGAGGFAPARQQRLAQFDQAGAVLLAVGGTAAAQQRTPALGDRGQQVREKGIAHGGQVESIRLNCYMDLRWNGSQSRQNRGPQKSWETVMPYENPSRHGRA